MSTTKEIVNLTKALVSFKTTSDNLFELDRCINFIQDYFSGSEVVVKKFVNNKKPSLVITMHDTKKPELFMLGHIDVVPANDKDFIPKVKNGKLFGRGSYDNKASVASIMHLMREFSKKPDKPSIGLMITSDEETGGEDGINHLLKKQGYRSNFVIVPDGGKLDKIITKEKGLLHLKVSAKGKAAHGAYIWKGENAIEKLMSAYGKIKRMFPETTKNDRWKTTVNLGQIKGGNAANVVPNHAEMILDIRYTEQDSKDKIIKKMNSIPRIKVELLKHGSMFKAKDNVYTNALQESAQGVLKQPVMFSATHGASDIRFFGEHNIPGLLFLPQGDNAHAEKEHVDINSMKQFYSILTHFIDNHIKII